MFQVLISICLSLRHVIDVHTFQLYLRCVGNCKRLESHFGEEVTDGMIEELKALKKRLDPRGGEETGGFNAFLGFVGGGLGVSFLGGDSRSRSANPNPGMAMRWLRQADHDIAAAENDFQPTR